MNLEITLKLTLSVLLAIIPALIWGYIFYKKQKGQKKMLLITFIAGSVFVAPLLLYKYLWQYFPWINAFNYTQQFQNNFIGFADIQLIPLDVFLTFMLVGVIEEVTKLWAVKFTDKGRIATIDDAIEMSIMAALGFAFAENILYFYTILHQRGVEGLMYPFIFRSMFSTFAHIMFSGTLGYYYGLSLFATEVLKEKQNKKKRKIIRTLAKILHMKKNVLFHEEKLTEGLLIAITLHAFFNIILEMNWIFLIVPYLTIGYIYLNYLLNKKEYHKKYLQINTERNDLVPVQEKTT